VGAMRAAELDQGKSLLPGDLAVGGSRWLDLDLVREQGSGRKKEQMRERGFTVKKREVTCGVHPRAGAAEWPIDRGKGKLNIAIPPQPSLTVVEPGGPTRQLR
jgi:hypothetical protein